MKHYSTFNLGSRISRNPSPKTFRERTNNTIANTTEAIMFRCTTQPVQINIGAFPIHEFKKDLIWDNKTSFLVDQNRYKLMTEVTCKGSGVYIFYGIQNVEKSD